MSYAVWLDGTKLGDSSLEIKHGTGRRAGIFHPTVPGLAVLPGITAMAPALLAAGKMCREAGLDSDDPAFDTEGAAEAAFASPAGRRILEAAKLVARLELRRPDGRGVPWESILISDMNELTALAQGGPTEGARAPERPRTDDPVRYFISTKLKRPHRSGARLSRSLPRH